MDKHVQVTQQGLEALKKEYDDLLNNKRPKVVDRLSNARLQGDLAENSDYQSAKDELEFLDGRIEELEEVIKNAKVADGVKKTDEVAVGTKVKVKVNDNETLFEIVGEWEADPKLKKISHASPLGQSLMGRKKGESVEVQAPAGKIIYTILDIE
jgi:transcription elongation factor GreA